VNVIPDVIASRLPRWPVLLALLVLVPFAEVGVLIASGRQFGIAPTLLTLIGISALGGWLTLREGPRTWQALITTVRAGEMPHRQLLDGALVLVGATLLLTPGFITDLVGLIALAPPTRPVARRIVAGWIARRARRSVPGMSSAVRLVSSTRR
jgi:UPF0716 protein FxsA